MKQFFKRLEDNKVLQVWIRISEPQCVRQVAYTCERDYFGEGIKESEMTEIDITEFKNLAWLYNCLNHSELELLNEENIEEFIFL